MTDSDLAPGAKPVSDAVPDPDAAPVPGGAPTLDAEQAADAEQALDSGQVPDAEQDMDAAPAADADLRAATVRRAPRFGAFIVVGGLLGFLVTAIVTMQFPADPAVGLLATVGYFSIFGISAGIALGALVAIVLDRRSRRRSRRATVEHAAVRTEPTDEAVDTTVIDTGSGALADADLSPDSGTDVESSRDGARTKRPAAGGSTFPNEPETEPPS